MTSIILRRDHEKSLLRRHPWVFSGAVARVDGAAAPGETVEIRDAGGARLALGAYSPASQIRARVWSFEPADEISPPFFRSRLEASVRARDAAWLATGSTACRLVNAESDGLPGLIVDRYGRFLVCQFLGAGAEFWRSAIVEELVRLTGCEGIFERSDANVREKEGLALRTGPLWGREPPDRVEIEQDGCRFLVDVRSGHKTGFYLDQRENRVWTALYTAGAEVLNAFAYTGSFGVWALRGGAVRVTNVESSAAALEMCSIHTAMNGFDASRLENVDGDVFRVLRSYRDAARSFDAVILDPPKFAEARSQLDWACRGYKDINLLAFKLLRPGGTLITFSCSGLVGPDLFGKIVADGALDARRQAQIVRRLGQAGDHPTALCFPEGAYLKGLVCRVV